MSNSPLGMTWDEYLEGRPVNRPEEPESGDQPVCWRTKVQSLCEMTTGGFR